jgi:hypothetical protein
MNPTNLSALWGPTLLTVDSQIGGGNFSDTSYEAEVCINFLEHFLTLFSVDPEELKREEDILEVLKKVHLHDKGKVPNNPSGNFVSSLIKGVDDEFEGHFFYVTHFYSQVLIFCI